MTHKGLLEMHMAHILAFKILVRALHRFDIIEKTNISAVIRGLAEDIERETPDSREILMGTLKLIAESIDDEKPPKESWLRGVIDGGESDDERESDDADSSADRLH